MSAPGTVLEVARVGLAFYVFRVDPGETANAGRAERLSGPERSSAAATKIAKRIAEQTGERIRRSGEA